MSEAAMPKPGPAPFERTEEQHALVRRRALPVAAGAFICGLAGIAMLLFKQVGAHEAPSLFGVSLCYCAMPMGLGLVFYMKGTSGTRGALVLSLLAIASGMGGSILYTKQAVQFKEAREKLEMTNLSAIATSAKDYAAKHEGAYPEDILVLLEEKLITPQNLQSPYGKRHELFDHFEEIRAKEKNREELLKAVETESDYFYLGKGMKVKDWKAPGMEEVVVAGHSGPVLRLWPLAFGNGEGKFVPVDDALAVMDANNRARTKLGFGESQLPATIRKQLDEAKEAVEKEQGK